MAMKCCGNVTASGSTGRNGCRFPYTPVEDGRSPVSRPTRDGLHEGAAQYARVKFTPRDASAKSRFYCPRCLVLRRVLRWLARFSVRKLRKAVA